MRKRLGLIAFFAVAALGGDAWTAEPPKPDFDRVDHTKPKKALALCPQFGSAGAIKKIAKGLKQDDPVATIRAVDNWIKSNFAYDGGAAYEWRDFKRMRKEKTYGGCADHAVLFGHLTRAAGIPTVFVKTMDCDWIRAFVVGQQPPTWSGHCFLEVYLHDRWMLLDASMMRLYGDYDPSVRLVPGNRYAYDKGHDPYKMVKSMRWELWKEQTAAYFKDFDLSKLGVGGGLALQSPPVQVHTAANGTYYQWIGKRLKDAGINYHNAFNSGFDKNMWKARGRFLLITCVGEQLVFPEKFHRTHLPLGPGAIKAALEKRPFGFARRVAYDGTRVVLVYARDKDAMRKAVDALEFE